MRSLRNFIHVPRLLLLALALWPGPSPAAQPAAAPAAVLFWADGFPARPGADRTALLRALEPQGVRTLAEPADLAAALEAPATRLLVLPYGGAFPLRAWGAIRGFLARGGHLLCLGGPPFAQPVSGGPGSWRAGRPDPSFAQGMGVGPAEPVDLPAGATGRALAPWDGPLPVVRRAWALTLRLASTRSFPAEEGSQGPADAVLRPLVHLLDRGGTARACALLERDQVRGEGAGGRWILAPVEGTWPEPALHRMVDRALAGAVELRAQVHPACAEPGEPLRLRVQLLRPGAPAGAALPAVRVDGVALALAGEGRHGVAEMILPPRPAPGLHRVRIEVDGSPGQHAWAEAGWRNRDVRLLGSGQPLTAGRDWLRLEGRAHPLAGTTYFGPGSHRHFLFEPDPPAWERDFARMRAAGINLVRTGLWTGWSRVMPAPGSFDDLALRALDAFVATAAAHRIHVCFSFFAFQPPLWGGANAYLDPRSLDAQRAFVGTIAARYRDCPWVHWDLINEPSYGHPDRPWTHRPSGDVHERRAWAEWVKARFGPLEDLPARWGEGDPLALPAPRDFGHAMVRDGRAPRKAAAFARFAQEVVADWAADLRAAIRAAAGPGALVTLGQDEGGTGTRPMPALHGDRLDYTCIHTWWADEDLLFDSLVAKLPDRPCLVQETGLMRLEDLDGRPWRSPSEAAALLERKLVMALLGRGAGAVQWAWDIDPLLPVDNEAVIGIWRPDGTAKPELEVLTAFAGFLAAAAPHLEDWAPPRVGVLVPHQRLWLGRPQGEAGARRLVRALAEGFGLVPALISDQRGRTADLDGLDLLIVPTLEEAAPPALALLEAARARGLRLLVLGPLAAEPGQDDAALAPFGGVGTRPLALREATPWGAVAFPDPLRQALRAGAGAARRPPESGPWREPLPLDLAREEGPLLGLLSTVLKPAGHSPRPATTGVLAVHLDGPRARLWGGTHEGTVRTRVKPPAGMAAAPVDLEPGRSFLRLLEPATGRVLAAYDPPQR